jgi:hypothetical protein
MRRAGRSVIFAVALFAAAVAGVPAATAGTSRPGPARSPFSAADGSMLYAESCPSATLCFAVGDYWNADATRLVPLAEKWNGKNWTAMHVPDAANAGESFLEAVSCSSAKACMAVGYYFGPKTYEPLADQWNGSHWVFRAVPHAGELWGVSCKSATFCQSVGYEYESSGYKELAAQWNGRHWAVQHTPDPGAKGSLLTWVSCVSTKWCSAVGGAQPTTQTEAPLAEYWNGQHWKVQSAANPAGDTDGQLEGESCQSPSSCYAVGASTNGSNEDVALAEHWNGRRWADQSSPPVSGATETELNSIACHSVTSCTAVGSFYDGAEYQTLAEHWNGHAWTVQQTPDVTTGELNLLSGVRCPAKKTCVAVGSYFDTSSGAYQTLAELWNGSQWTIVYPANPSD